MESVNPGRSVRLPYHFGQQVYLNGRDDEIPGTVVAFLILPGMIKADITWSDNPFHQSENFPCELSTDEPNFTLRRQD